MSDCPHCDELRAEVDYLKRELSLRAEMGEIGRMKRVFGMPAAVAQFTLALYHAKGQPVSWAELDDAVPAQNVLERSCDAMKVYACRARKALGADTIESIRSRGYQMTAEGLGKVGAALERARAEVAT